MSDGVRTTPDKHADASKPNRDARPAFDGTGPAVQPIGLSTSVTRSTGTSAARIALTQALNRSQGNRVVSRSIRLAQARNRAGKPLTDSSDGTLAATSSAPSQRKVQRLGEELTERQKIDKAMESDDPSDIKEIKDWNQANEKEKIQLASSLAFNYRLFFGPRDRSTMWAIWTSFGNNLPGVVSRSFPTWEKCVDVYSALKDLQPVKDTKDAFKADIEKVAKKNLDDNITYLMKEKASVEPFSTGNEAFDSIPMMQKAKADRLKRIESMKQMAKDLLVLRQSQRDMLKIEVGYEWSHGFGDNMDRKTYHPLKKPSNQNTKSPTWDDIDVQWQLASKEIADKAGRYPWLYGYLRDEQGEKALDNITAFKDPEKAGAEMAAAISQLMTRADAIKKRIGRSVNWYELVPIRMNLLKEGKWSKFDTFENWAAVDAIGKKENEEWWTEFGIQVAAEVGLIAVTLATAGTVPLFVGLIGAAAAIGAPAAAAMSESQQANKLADVKNASVLPGTDLVAQAQIDEERAAAVSHAVQAAINAFMAGSALGEHFTLRARLLSLAEVPAADQPALLSKAIMSSNMGPLQTAELTGKTYWDLLREVGQTSEAGQAIRSHLKSILRKPFDTMTESEIKALGMRRSALLNKGGKMFEVSREQALKDLLKDAERADIWIDSSEDAVRFLDARERAFEAAPGSHHAVTMGDTILVRPEYADNVRVLREEMIHAFQQRAGMDTTEVVEKEIEARWVLIKFRNQWAITNDEVREMIREIRQMKKTGVY